MFEEPYEIKFNLLKDDGYWEIGCKETVFVRVKHGVNEKCNHKKAQILFSEKHKENKFKIINVTYC